MSNVRVRFAPSPTGYLHIGGLRTALYNYLFARKEGGAFVLRIEDTDRSRFVDDAEQDVMDALKWAGLKHDEGPTDPEIGKDDSFGPYRQSERVDTYIDYARKLVEAGHAYLAFDSPDEIEAMRARLATEENPTPRYGWSTRDQMRNSLTLSSDEVEELIENGTPYVIRLKIEPDRDVHFHDVVRGEVTFSTNGLDDQVLLKSDGMPTYHLANVVDDHTMAITHVIRGEEWLSSTPKHVLLYEAFGWDIPSMAHLPLILSPTGGKLSKRNAEKQGISVLVREYLRQGYEPEALINYLAMLGWNPGDEREVFSIQELVDAFSLERVGQAGIQFDLDKLTWFNEQHLRARNPQSIARQLSPDIESKYGSVDEDRLAHIVAMMLERISFAREIVELSYFFEDPGEYDEKAVRKRWKDDSASLLKEYVSRIVAMQEWTKDNLEKELRSLAESWDVGAGRIIHPIRLAVSGVSYGPGVFDLIHVLGPERVARRVSAAIERLS